MQPPRSGSGTTTVHYSTHRETQRMTRYVQLWKRRYATTPGFCPFCGSAWGGYANGCPVTICRACETPQCMSYGSGNGRCGVCYVGLLPGWSGSDRPCSFAKCDQSAVAHVQGKRYACKQHLETSASAAGARRSVAAVPERLRKDWQFCA